MSQFLALLPLAFAVAALACATKVAARLLRRTKISWGQSFAFAGLAVLLTGVARVLTVYIVALPTVVAIALGFALQLGAGAWYFSKRATTAEGARLGVPGGAKLAGVAVTLMAAFSFALLFLSQAVLKSVP